MTKSLTVPSFMALAVLFPDYQNLAYVKKLNVALPLNTYFSTNLSFHGVLVSKWLYYWWDPGVGYYSIGKGGDFIL